MRRRCWAQWSTFSSATAGQAKTRACSSATVVTGFRARTAAGAASYWATAARAASASTAKAAKAAETVVTPTFSATAGPAATEPVRWRPATRTRRELVVAGVAEADC